MEENLIQISGIQHFKYCKRRWALLYIENLWEDNYLTIEGDKIHEKAHDGSLKESRKNKIIERGTYISSKEYKLTGQCDIIEYHKDINGINIVNKEGKWKIIPIEYKHGNGESVDIDKYQLIAQILCLEEMFQTNIEYGYLYYKSTNKRIKIENNDEIKKETIELIKEMNEYIKKQYTPKQKKSKKCNNCSLYEKCNPKICSSKNVKKYLEEIIRE